MLKAHELFSQGAIGELTFLRCRYGHGGRPGYGEEWRADPAISGGGELLDQGVHAVDLFRWFAGEFSDAFGMIASYLWTAGGQVEDNGFATFRTAGGQIAQLHASWTQWKNIFSFEVFGRDGYLVAEGLGGSYGPERLTWGRRRPESGPPIVEEYEFPPTDTSWQREWDELVAAIREGREPLGSGYGGWQALRMLGAVYESHRTGALVRL
jgi:predicted dehydrogenase